MKNIQIFAVIMMLFSANALAAPLNCKATLFKKSGLPTQVAAFTETSLEGVPYYTAILENVSYSILDTGADGLLGNIQVVPNGKSTLTEAIAVSGVVDTNKSSQLIFSALSFGQATITCGNSL